MDMISSTPEDALLKIISDEMRNHEDSGDYVHEGVTSIEVQKHLGISMNKTKAFLDEMVDAGILERAMIRRHDRWGIIVRRKGYRLVGHE